MKKLDRRRICGLIFGLGLIVAGMANPAKRAHFLIWPAPGILHWPSSWAVPSASPSSRSRCYAGVLFHCWESLQQFPTISVIDLRLVGGSLLFGIGWGWQVSCPGPAVVLLGAGIAKGAAFLLAMIVGMLLVDRFDKNRKAD
jgi:uncharacterized membrane protein YedE/YeeE